MDPSPSMILLFILLGALLSAGRNALTQLPDSAVKKWAASENVKERRIARLLEKPSAFLDGIKLLSYACNLGVALFLFPVLLGLLRKWLFSGLSEAWHPLFWVAAFLLTVLILDVLCHQLPRRVACAHPRAVAGALEGLCRLAAWLARPFVWLNRMLAIPLSMLFGAGSQEEPAEATEEEIRMMVDVGSEKGAIERSEKEMINNIFEFDDRCVSEVMTHRTDMTAVPKTVSLQEVAKIATETGFSRIPVYEDNIDDIIGILYVKDLLPLLGSCGPQTQEFDPASYMRTALFVPENMSCVNLFAQFKQKKVMVAIAVDEYGGTAGIVSMEDLLESIVGNLQDEYDDEEEPFYQIGENSWELDGTAPLDDVDRLLDIHLEEESEHDTIGGMMVERLERLPEPGEHPSVVMQGITFTVLLVEDRRIARVRAQRPPKTETEK